MMMPVSESNGSVNGNLLAPNLDMLTTTRFLTTPPPPSTAVTNSARLATTRPISGDQLQVNRDKLSLLGVLGHGIYGEVAIMRGVGLQPDYPNQEHNVVVKSFTSKEEHARAELGKEIDMYARLNHTNIAALLGISNEAEPYMVIMEFLEWGTLKHYMLASLHYGANCPPASSYPPPLTPTQIINVIRQVCSGMQYLTDNRFVHQDLAARNVLVSTALQAKITSLSLSSDKFKDEYYTYRHLVLPLRWMPPEAFFDDEWSMKSDIWSFGVFVWELYSTGQMPHGSLSDEEVIDWLKRGDISLEFTIPTGPLAPPAELLNTLPSCWETDPRQRPSFDEMTTCINRLLLDAPQAC